MVSHVAVRSRKTASVFSVFWNPFSIRVRTIVQKTDSPIVDSIGQNYRPMR